MVNVKAIETRDGAKGKGEDGGRNRDEMREGTEREWRKKEKQQQAVDIAA